MAYTRINYSDFGPYKTERVAGRGVKKISWDKIVCTKELDGFGSHFQDERTKVILQTIISMPFDVYMIPSSEAWAWADYLKTQPELGQVFNSVYLLFGHDFIYVGKSVNGDRILGHIADETKDGFEYQILFAPNNDNPYTMANWTSGFMSYLESLMIDRIMHDNPFCRNAIKGKRDLKNRRDLNLNEDKECFAENVIDLILEAFADISYSSYLLPEDKRNFYLCEPEDETGADSEDRDMINFWTGIIQLAKSSGYDNEFVKLTPTKYQWIGLNINKLIDCSSIGCAVTQSTCRVELVGWGSRQCAQTNLEVFDKLISHKDEIERDFGCALRWDRNEDKYTTRISVSKTLSFLNSDNGTQRDISDFFAEYFQKFYDIMPKYWTAEE